MTIHAGELLLRQVRPIIRAVIGKGKVRAVGCEDAEELEADAMAQAAAIIESAERDGKEVFASSVAYYALRNLQKGRRFGCGAGDVMSPVSRISGKVRAVESLDAPVCAGDDDGHDDGFTLMDSLAATGEDPASQGARELDWDEAAGTLDDRERKILGATASGFQGRELAAECRVSAPRITQLKREIGEKLRYAFGCDALAACVCEPVWQAGLRAGRERRACRYA